MGSTRIRTRCAKRPPAAVDGGDAPGGGHEYALYDASDQFRWSSNSNSSPSKAYRTWVPDASVVSSRSKDRWNRTAASSGRSRVMISAGNASSVGSPDLHDVAGRPRYASIGKSRQNPTRPYVKAAPAVALNSARRSGPSATYLSEIFAGCDSHVVTASISVTNPDSVAACRRPRIAIGTVRHHRSRTAKYSREFTGSPPWLSARRSSPSPRSSRKEKTLCAALTP